jgi:hypothetical protein
MFHISSSCVLQNLFGKLFVVDETTEYTEWQWPLSGIHSIMIEKSALVVRVGGARSTPFTISTIIYKVVVYTPDEKADTLPLFLLYPYMYSLWQEHFKY